MFRLNDQWRLTKLCAELLEAISNGVSEHHVYAVRSSGTFEDGESTSSAGQYITKLGCAGRTCEIAEAVLECWSSNFSARALTYRKYIHIILFLNVHEARIIQFNTKYIRVYSKIKLKVLSECQRNNVFFF